MQKLLVLTILGVILRNVVAPPVTEKKKEQNEEELADTMEYHRYLKEVVNALESDDEFRKKLEKVEEADIRNGKIADELEFVNHNIRTKLDELKRMELERLRRLAVKQFELQNGYDTDHLKIVEHIDHENPHTFEIEDLKKLIAKTTKDLNEADKKRREEFKEYEMKKKFEEDLKKKAMNEDEKKKYEEELKNMKEKHKKHEPLHAPGSKQQLEEVWEKQDHMENQEFDPKIFFHLHDLDGNGVWDQNEVKALFIKELNKMYEDGHPEDDIRERAEEMERMREHVFNEADVNKDGLLSYEEFMAQSKKPEFQKDPGWDGLDEQQLFSESEYESYLKQQDLERRLAYDVSTPGSNVHVQNGYAQQHQYQQPAQNYQPNNNQYLNLPPQVPYDNRAPQHPQYNQPSHHQPQYQAQHPQQQPPYQAQPLQQQSLQYQAQPPQQQQPQYQAQASQQQLPQHQAQPLQQQQPQYQAQPPVNQIPQQQPYQGVPPQPQYHQQQYQNPPAVPSPPAAPQVPQYQANQQPAVPVQQANILPNQPKQNADEKLAVHS